MKDFFAPNISKKLSSVYAVAPTSLSESTASACRKRAWRASRETWQPDSADAAPLPACCLASEPQLERAPTASRNDFEAR